jgi:hypothetical protein
VRKRRSAGTGGLAAGLMISSSGAVALSGLAPIRSDDSGLPT